MAARPGADPAGPRAGAAPVALVTGAAGSIGTRLQARLTEAGYRVVGVDLPAHCPVDDPAMIGCDITDEDRVHAVLAQVVETFGRLDLLVNNAGISAVGRFTDHTVADHRRVMEVNHLGAVACTQAALPALRASRGRVVAISSVTGFAPVVGRPAYVAAKHAMTGLFDSLRPELARQGVAVTLVHPTFVSAPLGLVGGGTRTTTGDTLTPDDVARAVVDAVRRGRDRVLVGRTAHLSWHLHRLAPRTYTRIMTRRLTP